MRKADPRRLKSASFADSWHLFVSGWEIASQRLKLVVSYSIPTLVASLSAVAAALTFAEMLRRLTVQDRWQLHGSIFNVSGLWVLWAACAVLSLWMAALRRICANKIDLFFSETMRKRLLGRILHQTPVFFHTHDPGRIAAIENEFTVEAAVTTRQVSIDLPLQVIVVAISTVAIIYNLRMPSGPSKLSCSPAALLVILAAIISLYLTNRLSGTVQRLAENLNDRKLALATLINGVGQSSDEIQTFAAEALFQLKHSDGLNRLADASSGLVRTSEYLNLLSDLPSFGVRFLLLGFVIILALRSQSAASIGNVVAILQLTPGLLDSIVQLSGYVLMANAAAPKVRQIEDIIAAETLPEERTMTFELDCTEASLEARNLTFSYGPTAHPVFRDVSFTVPPGKITGFVARTGQGKTTFFKLALRF